MSDTYDGMARVLHVADEYTVVINKGSADNVQLGGRYLIFALGPELKDPDTKESLGQLEIVRGRAKVVHVQGRMSTLRTIETASIPGKKKIVRRQKSGGFLALQSLMLDGPEVEEIEENPTEVDVELNADTGDYAKQI